MRSPTSATPEARTPQAPAAANAAVVEGFYAALGRRDAEAMIRCYAPDATFRDPVFGRLDHDAAAAMWRMLCERGRDLEVRASDVVADGDRVRAHWSATYSYSATGRMVRNEIDATFVVRDGRIVTHEDRFSVPRWARQALGPEGSVLGLPGFRLLIRRRAAAALARYRAR
jgi:ketosteroid isomerase-like protein